MRQRRLFCPHALNGRLRDDPFRMPDAGSGSCGYLECVCARQATDCGLRDIRTRTFPTARRARSNGGGPMTAAPRWCGGRRPQGLCAATSCRKLWSCCCWPMPAWSAAWQRFVALLLEARADLLAADLAWWAHVLAAARWSVVAPPAFVPCHGPIVMTTPVEIYRRFTEDQRGGGSVTTGNRTGQVTRTARAVATPIGVDDHEDHAARGCDGIGRSSPHILSKKGNKLSP